MLAAIDVTQPVLVFYENVVGVAEHSKNAHGERQRPFVQARSGLLDRIIRAYSAYSIYIYIHHHNMAVSYNLPVAPQDMTADLHGRGLIFEWDRVDSQDYLLRQRRNRVWGTADVDRGQDQETYSKLMKQTMRSMASSDSFPFEDVFDTGLPATPGALTTHQQRQRVEAAVKEQRRKARPADNLFVVCASSQSRGCEYAYGVTTCLRPTHQVWSTQLGRHVTVAEMWKAQGLWVEDFPNPAAARSMLDRGKDAQDLCGNSFSATVAQAKLMASLAHARGWSAVAESKHDVEADEAGAESHPSKRRRIGGKKAPVHCAGYEDIPWKPFKIHSQPTRKRRGRPRKDSPQRVPRNSTRKGAGGDGPQASLVRSERVKRMGKQGSLTIWTKVQLLKDCCDHIYIVGIVRTYLTIF